MSKSFLFFNIFLNAVKLTQLVWPSFMVREVVGSIPSGATFFAHMKN